MPEPQPEGFHPPEPSHQRGPELRFPCPDCTYVVRTANPPQLAEGQVLEVVHDVKRKLPLRARTSRVSTSTLEDGQHGLAIVRA